MWQKRLGQVVGYVLLLGVAGIGYGMFVQATGLAIPCIFHLVTGFWCPGCGVTHMCVALLQLDFAKAFQSNQALFLLMPMMIPVFVKYLADYVKTGKWYMNRIQTGILYVSIIILVLFGIVRNIFELL